MNDPNKAFKNRHSVEASMVCHICATNFTVHVSIGSISDLRALTCTACSWINILDPSEKAVIKAGQHEH